MMIAKSNTNQISELISNVEKLKSSTKLSNYSYGTLLGRRDIKALPHPFTEAPKV
jgi:hypothetical protein